MEPPSSPFLLFNPLHSGAWVLFTACLLSVFMFLIAAIAGGVWALNTLNSNKKNKSKTQFIIEKNPIIIETLYILSAILLVCIMYLTHYLVSSFLYNVGSLYLVLIEAGILAALLLLILLFKRYGTNNSKIAITFFIVIKIIWFLFSPFAKIIFPKKNIDHSDDSASETENVKHSQKMFTALQNTADIEVKEILASRMDITAVDISMDFNELFSVVVEAGYSRLPVYEEDFDHVKGILYVKDILPYIRDKDSNFKWQDLIHEAYFVVEHKKINALLDEMKHKKIHMAIVVDEYGGTIGIVTLEDILEEIVGEIFDESDIEAEETFYVKLKDGSYSFEGKTPLVDFCRIMQIDPETFEETKGNAETLAGLLLELKGEFLQRGEEIRLPLPGLTFKVENIDERRIRRIRVTKDE